MFAAGASDRQVADALGVGAGTANRLRHRQADSIEALRSPAPADPPAAAQEPDPAQVAVLTDAAAAVIGEEQLRLLTELRAEHAEVLAAHVARAEASRTAVLQLEYERREALAQGRDASPLRDRRANAQADRDDSEEAARMAQGRLDAVDQQIAQLLGKRGLDAAESEFAAAAAWAAEVDTAAAKVLRDAVTAVRAAAGRLVSFRADVADAQRRLQAAHSAVSTARAVLGMGPVPLPVLNAAAVPAAPVHGAADPGYDALSRAWQSAGVAADGDPYRTGARANVAAELAAAGDVYGRVDQARQDRPRREQEARQLAAARAAELAELQARQDRGPGLPPVFPGTMDRDRSGRALMPGTEIPVRPGDHPSEFFAWEAWH